MMFARSLKVSKKDQIENWLYAVKTLQTKSGFANKDGLFQESYVKSFYDKKFDAYDKDENKRILENINWKNLEIPHSKTGKEELNKCIDEVLVLFRAMAEIIMATDPDWEPPTRGDAN